MKKEWKDLIAKAAEMEDQTVMQSSFSDEPVPAGKTVGRMVEYIELGKHAGTYEGKPKAPSPQVRVTFELLGPKYIREIEVNGEKKKVADRISVTLNKSFSDKAGFYKLLQSMRYGRQEITHMSQMLGEAFVITVVHSEKKDPKDKVYANVYNKQMGAWGIEPPFKEDAIANTKEPYAVPKTMGIERLFIWDTPTQECWDSLFIDGERTVKKDGVDVKQSKNWIQNKIMTATNFKGSPLDNLIDTSIPTIDEMQGDVDSGVDFEPEMEQPKETKAKSTTKKASAKKSDDPLADLGLN